MCAFKPFPRVSDVGQGFVRRKCQWGKLEGKKVVGSSGRMWGIILKLVFRKRCGCADCILLGLAFRTLKLTFEFSNSVDSLRHLSDYQLLKETAALWS